MALVLDDRVKETSTTTGTGTLNLSGAVSGFQTFVAGIGDGNTTYYAIVNRDEAEWETGLGTVTDSSTDTLARTTVIASSNSDSAVDFSAGTKDVFTTLPASKAVYEDASSDVTLPDDLILGSDSAVLKFGADSDTTLTHTDGTGLTLNTTNKLLFRDSALYINSSTDGQLDIVADTEVQIAATTIDINGAVALNGAITGATDITLSGELDAATLDISGNADIDGTLDIAGTTTLGGTVTVNAGAVFNEASDDVDFRIESDTQTHAFFVDANTSHIGINNASPSVALDVTGDANISGEISVTTLDIGGTNVTSTAAELNILDGVTATAAELNIMDGVTSTAAELNIMDGVTSTAAEINLIDGGTARGTTALADGDGILINDGGTMRMTNVTTVKTYMSTSLDGIDDQTSSNDDQLTITDSEVCINEDSDDLDFRVEGNGDANLMIVDGGADNVSFSRGSAATDQAIVHISRGGYDPGSNGKHALMVGANIGDANTLSDGTRKFGSVVCPHYTNAEEPLTFMNIDSDNGSSVMTVGGYSTTNTVEKITFRTATDDADKTTGADRMVIDSSGGMYINTTDGSLNGAGDVGDVFKSDGSLQVASESANPLTVNRSPNDSNDRILINFYRAANNVGLIGATNSATHYNTNSDYRLKENETAITDGITRIKQLKPYRFNFKIDADKTVDGFFAHEVSGIVPEAICGDKDAMIPEVLYTADDELPEGKSIGDVKEVTKIDPQSIDQSKLIPLLTSALQEAITKIETLESKVAVLEG